MKKKMLLTTGFVVLMAGAALAAPIGPAYGAVYNGGVFTLQLLDSSTPTTKYVTYTADLTNFTGDNGQQDFLYGIGFFPSPSDPTSASSVNGPVPSGGSSNWTLYLHELNANGCTGGNASFACAGIFSAPTQSAVSTQGAPGSGPTYQWTFTLVYGTVPSNFTLDGISIKAAFSNDRGGLNQRGLMSETTTLVPEPGTLLLLGTGLVGLAAGLRRRK